MSDFRIFAVKGSYAGFDSVKKSSGYLQRKGEVVKFKALSEALAAIKNLDSKNCVVIDFDEWKKMEATRWKKA